MEDPSDIPDYLKPDANYGHLHVFKLTRIWKTLDDFTKEFGIELEAAILATLAGLAHAMGGLVRTSTTFGSIEPPFSLLLVTPVAEPVWTEVPIRFLTHEFDASMRQSLQAFLIQRETQDSRKDEDPSDTSLKSAAELANRLCVDGLVERISTSSVLFPFPRSLIDNHVLITTPPVGIRRALRQLEPLQKFRLENALSTGARLVAPDGVRSSGVPSFYWQITKNQLPLLLKENPWLVGIPFIALESARHGKALLDPSSPSVDDLLHRCRELVAERHVTMGNSRTIYTDSKTFRPCQKFLKKAHQKEGLAEDNKMLSPLRILELALKFTSILTILDRKREPEMLEVMLGLELAKRAAIRRYRILQAALPQQEEEPAPHLEGLSPRERDVFLRVVERGGLTKTELGRSFNRMRKEERDEILAALCSRKLLKLEDGKVFSSVA